MLRRSAVEWATVVSSFFGAALGVVAGLASECLKVRITGEFWVAQERWRLKRETYTDLLKCLFGQKFGVEKALKLMELLEGTGADPKEARDEIVKILADEVGEPSRRIREHRVVGALWLRGETLAALDAVDEKLRATALADPTALTAIDDAVARVVAEAREDLRLEVRGI
jgi:hypothetical protein